MNRTPTLFISHGSPMHAIDPGGAGAAWRAIAAALPKPRAVLVASAHWETSLPMLSGREQLDTIHDFGGFPAELYRVRYDVPGSPAVAQRAATLLREAGLTPSVNSCRGIDHGAWVPLKWMYPERDVPVVQLSVQTSLGTAHHLQVGAALAPLAEEGVLVVGSGHATHNLRDWFAHHADPQPLDYVVRFSSWLKETLAANDRDALVNYRDRAPGATRAHPTEEHFLPLFVALGAAGADAQSTLIHEAIDGAALAMDAYRFD
jgi:4,5-DOPA dioxygenase extradiol